MINLNQRVSESREKLEYLPSETIKAMCDFLLSELGDPANNLERLALEALQKSDYDAAKKFCLADPCNNYLAAISCIASAYRSPMVADSVLRDASRHTADVARLKAATRIAKRFQEVLG